MKENNMSPMDCQLPQQERDGKTIRGEGVRCERIRRITGYLVGSVDRFNNAKRAEVADRVKHTTFR